jgi:2-methylisocitrate lyase-like PEP mutase family enzyme
VFLLEAPSALDEGKRRSAMYTRAGANGLFFPGLTGREETRAIVKATTLPINIISSAKLPQFSDLKDAGVRRISMGPFLNKLVYGNLEEVAKKIVDEQTLSYLFQAAS